MSANERLTAVVDPVVSECGFVLDGVAVSMAGKRRLVRITLDRLPEVGADGWTTSLTTPLSLDEVADVSREINGALEVADVFGAAPYVLEVSSPGVGKPLREPRHFRRNVGRLLEVTTTDAPAPVSGRVVRANETAVALTLIDPDTTETVSLSLPYAEITRAVVTIEFTDPTERN